MKLSNFPLRNGRPRGAEQTKNYIEALQLKRTVDQMATAVANTNDKNADLDDSPDAVAINNVTYKYVDLKTEATGILSLSRNEAGEAEPDYMYLDIDPWSSNTDRTLTYRKDGELNRYTDKSENSETVRHLVHDTATDTISFFSRNQLGQFIAK